MNTVTFAGTVKSHDKNGRTLGYPTANIDAPPDAPSGIFAGIVELGSVDYPAMIFIGEPVTLGKTERRAEAHILDFPDRDLYGEPVKFTLCKHIRDNQEFVDVNTLIRVIKRDEKVIRAFFEEKGYNKDTIHVYRDN